jgi:hypothetical protein
MDNTLTPDELIWNILEKAYSISNHKLIYPCDNSPYHYWYKWTCMDLYKEIDEEFIISKVYEYYPDQYKKYCSIIDSIWKTVVRLFCIAKKISLYSIKYVSMDGKHYSYESEDYVYRNGIEKCAIRIKNLCLLKNPIYEFKCTYKPYYFDVDSNSRNELMDVLRNSGHLDFKQRRKCNDETHDHNKINYDMTIIILNAYTYLGIDKNILKIISDYLQNNNKIVW